MQNTSGLEESGHEAPTATGLEVMLGLLLKPRSRGFLDIAT